MCQRRVGYLRGTLRCPREKPSISGFVLLLSPCVRCFSSLLDTPIYDLIFLRHLSVSALSFLIPLSPAGTRVLLYTGELSSIPQLCNRNGGLTLHKVRMDIHRRSYHRVLPRRRGYSRRTQRRRRALCKNPFHRMVPPCLIKRHNWIVTRNATYE